VLYFISDDRVLQEDIFSYNVEENEGEALDALLSLSCFRDFRGENHLVPDNRYVLNLDRQSAHDHICVHTVNADTGVLIKASLLLAFSQVAHYLVLSFPRRVKGAENYFQSLPAGIFDYLLRDEELYAFLKLVGKVGSWIYRSRKRQIRLCRETVVFQESPGSLI